MREPATITASRKSWYVFSMEEVYLFPAVFLLDFLLDTHDTSLEMQEADLGEPLTDMQVWEKMKMKKVDLTEPQPSFPKFFGNAKEHIASYVQTFQGINPEVENPLREETDPRAVVMAGHGWEHGRPVCLSSILPHTPELGLTRVKATLTADDPPIQPSRRSSRARLNVSFLNFILFFTWVPKWLS